MAQTLILLLLSWVAPLALGRALVLRVFGPGPLWLPLGAVLGLGATGSLLFLWAFAFGLGRASIVALVAFTEKNSPPTTVSSGNESTPSRPRMSTLS